MHFCRQCQNMYYIKIDETNAYALTYYCRNCGCTETNVAATGKVLSTPLNHSVNDFSHLINQYTKLDPTLPRINTVLCPNADCATNRHGSLIESKKGDDDDDVGAVGAGSDDVEREIIYIRYDDTNMKYVYLCSTCDTVWKTEDHS